MLWGIYESAEIRFIRKYLRPDLDVVELGSSIGVTTGHALSSMGADHRMLAVEANPDLLTLLRLNINAHAAGKRVDIVNAAVTYENAGRTASFVLSAENFGSMLGPDGIEIPATTMSGLLEHNAVGQFALVSDIEGAEAPLFIEDGDSLVNCQQMIIEFHETSYRGRRYSAEEVLEMAMGLGFKLTDRRGPVACLDRPVS